MKQNKNLRRKLKIKAIKEKGELLHFQASMQRLLNRSKTLEDQMLYMFCIMKYQILIDKCDDRIKEL